CARPPRAGGRATRPCCPPRMAAILHRVTLPHDGRSCAGHAGARATRLDLWGHALLPQVRSVGGRDPEAAAWHDRERGEEVAQVLLYSSLRVRPPRCSTCTNHWCRSCLPRRWRGEVCRSEARDRRRGRTAALDAMWRDVRRTAHPRWLWHAMEPHPGKGLS